jgi:hypothetical protein
VDLPQAKTDEGSLNAESTHLCQPATEPDKNKVCRKGSPRSRNLLRLARFPQGRTEQCFEPDSASLSLAEQVDYDEYDKNKVYRRGRPYFYGTHNRNRTCNYPLGVVYIHPHLCNLNKNRLITFISQNLFCAYCTITSVSFASCTKF